MGTRWTKQSALIAVATFALFIALCFLLAFVYICSQ